jgi:hypothetical protein
MPRRASRAYAKIARFLVDNPHFRRGLNGLSQRSDTSDRFLKDLLQPRSATQVQT